MKSCSVVVSVLVFCSCGSGFDVKPPTGEVVFDHAAFEQLLAAHVRDGQVDYPGLKGETAKLADYLRDIAGADVGEFASTQEQMAFFINAYNALTLKLIVDNYPLKSILDLDDGKVWRKRKFTVAGIQVTLDDIEHQIIRPIYQDYRVHFAVNCASVGCPDLAGKAYLGNELDSQLDAAERVFFAEPKNIRVETKDGHYTVSLSRILKWYGSDFADRFGDLERFIAAKAPISLFDGASPDPEKLTIRYLDYDWSLNEGHVASSTNQP